MKKLVQQFIEAKQAEAAAVAKRRELAKKIAAKLDHPDEGSKTHDVGTYKVTIRGTVNRKVDDWDAFDKVRAQHPPCKTVRKLDEVGLRWLEENDQATYRRYCDVITSKPGAIQVSVKEA